MVKPVKYSDKISVTAHLTELRDRLLFAAGTVLFFFGVCFYFRDFLVLWLEAPLPSGFKRLVFISPAEPFFIAMKISLMGAAFISMPVILYQVWQYIAPGLKVKEKKVMFFFISLGTLFFLAGGLFCYFLVLPVGLHYLLTFGADYWKMEVTISLYFDFVLTMLLAFACAFQTPLVMVVLTRIGVINTVKMRIYRKWAFLGAFVIGAILTPPDVVSQILLSVPLYLLYEFGILVSMTFEDPKQREEVWRQIRAEKEERRARIHDEE